MIGEADQIKESSTNVELLYSFKHKDAVVFSICPISSDTAWITQTGAGDFTHLRKDGHHIKTIQNDTSGLSFITHEDGFLVCNVDQKNILKVDMSGKSSVWMDTSPLESRYISKALKGNVLTAVVDKDSGIRTDDSHRKVQLVSPSGTVLKTYEFEENGITPALTRPKYVAQNGNSDVCVVNQREDAKNIWRGHVCVFRESGTLKFVYSGHGGPLNLRGICCDAANNIICVNVFDSTIHMISDKGDFLRYLFTNDTCIPKPYAMALHEGVLWVGSFGGEIRVYRYNN